MIKQNIIFVENRAGSLQKVTGLLAEKGIDIYGFACFDAPEFALFRMVTNQADEAGKILTENGAKEMGRPQGNYITIEAPELSVPDEDYHREVSEEIAVHLKQLIDLEKECSILVVGLGNTGITADSLGPRVVDNLRITRHMVREYGLKSLGNGKIHRTSGIIPGVMAQTGMETSEIVQGVVAETKPDVVIAVDALAARSVRRLNRTIQITDTGIHPGSGVGNHRNGLTEENLHVKVIGIGVPTVVDAATIVHDSMANLLDVLEEKEQKETLKKLDSDEIQGFYYSRPLPYSEFEKLYMEI